MLVKQQLATQEAEFATLFATHYQTLYVFYMSDIPYKGHRNITNFLVQPRFTNFESAFYKFESSPRFTNLSPVHVLQI